MIARALLVVMVILAARWTYADDTLTVSTFLKKFCSETEAPIRGECRQFKSLEEIRVRLDQESKDCDAFTSKHNTAEKQKLKNDCKKTADSEKRILAAFLYGAHSIRCDGPKGGTPSDSSTPAGR